MVVQLSFRKSLRWVPGEPSETTDTLVLDVGDHFVDLRILKADGSIDWGMAGKRTILSENPLKVQWTKEICSLDTESTDDVGIFEDLPNGDALEKGSMPNDAGEIQEYEEVWGSLPVPSSQLNWILRHKGDEGVTYIGKVGDYYQVLRKGKGGFDALREHKEGGAWVAKYEVGGKLPSIAALGEDAFDAGSWKQGAEVKVGEETYSVYALEKV